MSDEDSGRTPVYLDYYALNSPPFADQGDKRFFYAGSALMQRLDLLTHLTQFGDTLVVVSGPPGSGKTTLLRHFRDYAQDNWLLCACSATEADRLDAVLAECLGGEPNAATGDRVEAWIRRSDDNELLVLLVDDAERLEPAALERLLALSGKGGGSRVRLILFGTEDLNPLIKAAQEQRLLGQNVQWLEVPCLSEEETASYLMYRLAVAGYSGESPFTATEVRAICKAGAGRPAQINRLAHQTLTEQYARHAGGRRPAGGGRRAGQWATAAAVLALIGVVGWQLVAKRWFDHGESAPPAVELPLALPPQPPAPEVATPTAPETPTTPTPPAEEVAATPAQQTAPETATETPAEPAAAQPLAPAAVAQAPVAPPPPAPVDIEAPAPEPPVVEPAQKPAAQAAPPVHAPAAEAPPAEVPKTVEADKTPATPGAGQPHREDWLLARPAEQFTLQLIGLRKEPSIRAYIERHRLDPAQTAYYQGLFKGGPWYVLLYGVYPSQQAALEARRSLPPGVRSDKPWPRRLSSVHKAIREASPP